MLPNNRNNFVSSIVLLDWEGNIDGRILVNTKNIIPAKAKTGMIHLLIIRIGFIRFEIPIAEMIKAIAIAIVLEIAIPASPNFGINTASPSTKARGKVTPNKYMYLYLVTAVK